MLPRHSEAAKTTGYEAHLELQKGYETHGEGSPVVLEESGVHVAFLREPLEARERHERLLRIARVVRAMDQRLPLHPTTFLMIRPSWRRVLNDLALLAASASACNPFTHSPARPARSSTNTHIHTGFGFISQNVLIQWFWKVNFPTKPTTYRLLSLIKTTS